MTRSATALHRPSTLRLTLILGILSAASPLAVDMYLPAFDAIGRDLAADIGQVQQTFAAFAFATALSPLVYGPLSDRFGRKVPILLGMAGYVVTSILCSYATSFAMLLFLRVLQGAASGIGVLAQAVVRDTMRGHEALQLMTLIMLMHSVSPLLAPAIGSAVVGMASWRWIFVLLALPGLLAVALVAFGLPETLPPERRRAGPWRDTLRTYRVILRTRDFLIPALVGSAALATLLVYVASSSFILLDIYGLGGVGYSVIFGIGAALMIGAAQTGAPLARRFGTVRLVKGASAVMMAAGLAAGALAWLAPPLPVLLAVIWTMMVCTGLLMPATTVLALEKFEHDAGAAASLSNAFRNGLGALATVFAGLAFDGTVRPALLMIGLCGVSAFVCARLLGPETPHRVTVPEWERAREETPIL